MTWLRELPRHSWRLASASISGMLLTIVVAGLIALAVNERVWSILVETIQHDLDLEDHVDELWIAVIDLRYYHSNLALAGPTPQRIENFERAYQRLLSEISEFDQLELATPNLPQPDELRQLAQRFYADFQPAIKLYTTDWPTFELASDTARDSLTEMENRLRRIEQFGERHTGAALQDIEAAASTARIILIAKLIGHILIGGGFAYLVVRILRQQQQASAEIARTLQLKNDFIADISHELRTPLTVLRANAEVALDLERTCVHAELLEEIVRESVHMTGLVEDLLLLARSEAGALPFEWEAVSLCAVLQEVADRATLLASNHHLLARLDLPEETILPMDRARIIQALLILIDNAAHYSPTGTEIMLHSTLGNREVLIEVADQGPGIAEAELPLIFERFYRTDKARTRRSGGAGLGLAIAKSIIAAHNGRIEVASVLHQGTTIRVYLPLKATSPTLSPTQQLPANLTYSV